jgi:hypothetical protein
MISEAQKRAIMNWREKNPEVYSNYQKEYRARNPYSTTDNLLRYLNKLNQNPQLRKPKGAHSPERHEYE